MIEVIAAAAVLASADGCEISQDGKMSVCPVDEGVCGDVSDYASPKHFAETHGGVLGLYTPVPGGFVLIVDMIENGKMLVRLAFVHDPVNDTICLTHEARPIEEPAGLKV